MCSSTYHSFYHSLQSWGRYPKAAPAAAYFLHDRSAPLPLTEKPLLAFGNGRSYGDVCLNEDGNLLLTQGMDRFIEFDSKSGILRAEAGLLLSKILEITVPQGWFLPVTPGTRFVTLAGALANDVHGKNHHRAGTLGRHVRALELLRSDGSRRICSPTKSSDWFAATVAGLGLTGLITWVELQLRPIESRWIEVESISFPDLAHFFSLSAESDQSHEYTVAWYDCTGKGKALGRGIFLRGNHASGTIGNAASNSSFQRNNFLRNKFLKVPFTPPLPLVNQLSIRLFNMLYYHKPRSRHLSHYEPFFYPLDWLGRWNLIYGPNGFLQYQSVLPISTAKAALQELFQRIAASGEGSFLTVLKMFGSLPSPGLLSFPRHGATVALDFPFKGRKTEQLLDSLDKVVMQAGGALYPAKDARMSPEMFRASFPQINRFKKYIDKKFSSSFWRRMNHGAG